jgi:ferrochelatase
MSHTAVILIALGGPRSLDEVGPFMAAFMGRPAPPPVIQAVVERYRLIGGKSPLPEIVRAQAEALAKELGNGFSVKEGFRYSPPLISEPFNKAVTNGADRVIGLSMSPFATEVTTGTYRSVFESLGDEKIGRTFIPSWHDNPLFISSWAQKIAFGLSKISPTMTDKTTVIFTSHSIPLQYITAGDPYQRQIEETVKLIVHETGIRHWRVAWQSKGARTTEPWLGPDVETTLDTISQEGHKAVLEVPVGFTCDHMETLYDIDIVHRGHAEKLGLAFERAESLNTFPPFISALADVVRKAL